MAFHNRESNAHYNKTYINKKITRRSTHVTRSSSIDEGIGCCLKHHRKEKIDFAKLLVRGSVGMYFGRKIELPSHWDA